MRAALPLNFLQIYGFVVFFVKGKKKLFEREYKSHKTRAQCRANHPLNPSKY